MPLRCCSCLPAAALAGSERLPLQQLLTSFKSLDAHCLSETRVVFARSVWARAEVRMLRSAVAAPSGYRGQIELPPRRG